MNKVFKKWTTVVLAVVLTVAFMPAGFGALGVDAPGVDKAYAGGDHDINGLMKMKEPNGDESVVKNSVALGSTVSVSMSDLDDRMSGFSSDPNHEVEFCVYDDLSFSNPQTLSTSRTGDVYSATVGSEYAGKYISLNTGGHDTDYNNNSTPVPIKKKYYFSSGPSVTNVQYTNGPIKKDIYVSVAGYGYWYTTEKYNTSYTTKKTVQLMTSGGKVLQTKTTTQYSDTLIFKNVSANYNAKTVYKIKLSFPADSVTFSNTWTATVTGNKLGKNTVRATKLSKKKVIVKWSGVAGASGYYLYMGKKKIKTLSASKRKYTVNKKNAYKYRYKVVPYIKAGTKKYKGTSSAPKPKKNQLKLNRSTNYGSASYSTCPFRITKISLKGNVYTITGYAVNNRIYPMKKYKNFKLALYIDGKKAFSKKWSSKKINVKESSSKKIVIKVRGRAGVDLANYNTISYTEGGTPVWMWHGKVMKPL